jgi:hypothetical protein
MYKDLPSDTSFQSVNNSFVKYIYINSVTAESVSNGVIFIVTLNYLLFMASISLQGEAFTTVLSLHSRFLFSTL